LRAGKTSRTESAAAILGLIVLSVLMINVFDTSDLVNPAAPRSANTAPGPPSTGRPLNGTLVVLVTSNQNTTNMFAPPSNTSAVAEGVPVVATYAAANLPFQAEYQWTTNARGLTGCIACLPVGLYVLSIQYDGLNMTIPAYVFANNQTLVRVSITGKMYNLVYSQESGVLVTPISAEYTTFAQVRSSAPIANASQPVFLTVLQGASGVAGYPVNATVISEEAPTAGTQWLQLGTPSPVDPVNATSISLTAWTSSTATTVGPVTYSVGSLRP